MKILITGGTGLLGHYLSKQLLSKGHRLVYLSRQPGQNTLQVPEFYWNVAQQDMDLAALEGVELIIHLAGASINGRWTPDYKKEIVSSRVDSVQLLLSSVEKTGTPLQHFISASAVGYYPHDYQKTYYEDHPAGTDFLSQVCVQWEQAAQRMESLHIPVSIIRIGVVLSTEGGALPQMALPVKMGAGAALASGRQYLSWIHWQDLVGIMEHLLERRESGIYNAVAPQPVTNAEFTKVLARTLQRPYWPVRVPALALKLLLGEMAATALSSQRASADKISASGYRFQYARLNEALKSLYGK